MKIFFWMLVAVNAILFAVMAFFGGEPALVAPEAVHAEKIIVASEPVAAPLAASSPIASEVPAAASAPASAPVSAPVAAAPAPAPVPVPAPAPAPAPVAAAPAKSSACYEWGEFSGSDLEQAGLALKKLSSGAKIGQRETDRSIGFWVYIPPLKDKAASAEKVAQLKARGVTEYFVVQDGGEWQNAISLGVFKTRESAQNFLKTLQAKGVVSAKLGERSGKTKSVTFLIGNLDAETSARLMVVQKDFAGSDLKRVSCH